MTHFIYTPKSGTKLIDGGCKVFSIRDFKSGSEYFNMAAPVDGYMCAIVLENNSYLVLGDVACLSAHEKTDGSKRGFAARIFGQLASHFKGMSFDVRGSMDLYIPKCFQKQAYDIALKAGFTLTPGTLDDAYCAGWNVRLFEGEWLVDPPDQEIICESIPSIYIDHTPFLGAPCHDSRMYRRNSPAPFEGAQRWLVQIMSSSGKVLARIPRVWIDPSHEDWAYGAWVIAHSDLVIIPDDIEIPHIHAWLFNTFAQYRAVRVAELEPFVKNPICRELIHLLAK